MVIMEPDELEAIKKDARAKGRTEGHQSAMRFLKDTLDIPGLPIAFGEGFPADLRETVSRVVMTFRECQEYLRSRKVP